MRFRTSTDRRNFLRRTSAASGLLVAAGAGLAPVAAQQGGTSPLSPTEELMHDHGLLRRILLIYEESLRRLGANQELPPAAVAGAAGIIRKVVEDHHEREEEREIFPRLEKADRLVDLVHILTVQHDAGRKVTDSILVHSKPAALKNPDERRLLANAIGQYIRMYRPHASREDTVVFPEFRRVVSPEEFDAVGETLEKREHEAFGEDGMERFLEQIVEFEDQLGLTNLAQFTPSL